MKSHNPVFFLSGAQISAVAHQALSSTLSLVKRVREKEPAFSNLRKKYLSTFVNSSATIHSLCTSSFRHASEYSLIQKGYQGNVQIKPELKYKQIWMMQTHERNLLTDFCIVLFHSISKFTRDFLFIGNIRGFPNFPPWVYIYVTLRSITRRECKTAGCHRMRGSVPVVFHGDTPTQFKTELITALPPPRLHAWEQMERWSFCSCSGANYPHSFLIT